MLTVDEARAAIEDALASPALTAVRTAVTTDERQAFVDAALATVFVRATDSASLVTLAASAPAGTFPYHVELFHRFM
jgi:hypothetical protein